MQHVIIGCGPAGVVAAETLRRCDPYSSITLVGDEPELPYSRMAIPYLLIEKITEDGTHLRHQPQHYSQLGIQLQRGRVASLDAGQHQVRLTSGETLSYDRLLIATGSRPIRPPVPGMDLPGVHTCWTLHDARAITERARHGAKVVLIGAGFIGCIVLEALALRGVELTVVETGDRMVPRMMNATAGGMIKRWCESKGVRVFTSTSVNALEAAPSSAAVPAATGLFATVIRKLTGQSATPPSPAPLHPLRVHLNNGQVLEADLVISAAGVKPNLEWLAGSGIETQQGIMVNHYLQTNLPDVYAAGDVAQGRDFSTHGHMVQAIQPTATEHGRIAAQNMAGTPTYYGGSLNMNVLDTLGLISSSFGLWMGVQGGEQVEVCDLERYRYLSLQFQDDVLVGATSLGLTQHVGVLRGLIQGKVRLGAWKSKLQHDPTQLMQAYLACTKLAAA